MICSQCKTKRQLSNKQILSLNSALKCESCSKTLLPYFDKDLSKLTSDSYVHPLDKKALTALKKVPGIDAVLKTLLGPSFELANRLNHQANFIRVKPKQFGSIHKQLVVACKRLAIKEKPELYIFKSAQPNAYTAGVKKNYLALSTGCIDTFSKEELLAVLAHELGHIHAEHVLYKSTFRILGILAAELAQKTLGLGGLALYPIKLALSHWDRVSEFSADRVSLLVVKKPNVVLNTLMKLSGGTTKLDSELNLNSFIEQASEFKEKEAESKIGKYLSIYQSIFATHPHIIWRAKEIIEWSTNGSYLDLLQKLPRKPTKIATTKKKSPKAKKPKIEQNTKDIAQTIKDVSDWYKNKFG